VAELLSLLFISGHEEGTYQQQRATTPNVFKNKNPTDYGNLRGPPKPIAIEARKQGQILRDYFKGSIGVDLQEDDEQLAAEVHKVLVAEGAIGVTAVTSSAASASSASRVSPPRRGVCGEVGGGGGMRGLYWHGH